MTAFAVGKREQRNTTEHGCEPRKQCDFRGGEGGTCGETRTANR